MEAMHLYQVRRLFTAALVWWLVVADWGLLAGVAWDSLRTPARQQPLPASHLRTTNLPAIPPTLASRPSQDLFVPKKMRC